MLALETWYQEHLTVQVPTVLLLYRYTAVILMLYFCGGGGHGEKKSRRVALGMFESYDKVTIIKYFYALRTGSCKRIVTTIKNRVFAINRIVHLTTTSILPFLGRKQKKTSLNLTCFAEQKCRSGNQLV